MASYQTALNFHQSHTRHAYSKFDQSASCREYCAYLYTVRLVISVITDDEDEVAATQPE